MIIQKTACFLYVFIWLLRSVILVRSQGPRFKENMTEKYTVSLGQSVKLYCPVSGTDDPASNRTLVVWSYGGHFIVNTLRKWTRFKEKKNGKYLKIVRVKKEDAGLYTCRAYNEHGYIKMNITLTIKSPRTLEHAEKAPKFRKPARRSMPYKAGETAKLNCHSSGNPDPDVQWFKDGESYGQHKRINISPNGWTLNLRYLTVQDSGIYLCRVSNKLGSINRTFTVMVKESNKKKQFPLTVMSPMFLAEQAGKSLTIHCPVKPTVVRMYKYIRRIKKGKDLEYARRKLALLLGLKYKWYKDGKAIRHHRSAWFMKLEKVQAHDSGVYTCKVLTGKGGTKRNFTLHIYKQSNIGRPILQTRPGNISLKVGESLTLECVCNNTRDRPQVRWIKWRSDQPQLDELSNNIETRPQTRFPKIYDVIDSKNYGFFKSSRGKSRRKQKSYGFRLRLKDVKRNDTGMYTCHVWNKFGSDHVNFFSTVQPLIGVAPYGLNVRKMRNFIAWPALSSLTLKCYVNGERPLKYQWYKDGKRLLHRRLDPNMNTSSWNLRLREVVPSDSGVYTCVVSNLFGVFKHNITVKVVERIRSAPILLQSFPKNISASKGDNVSFECIELVSGPLPDYRWLKWHSIPATYPKLDVQNTSQYTIISPIHYKTIRVKSGRSYRYGGRLTINNITQDDIGLYTCRVSNHIGFDYSSAFLKMNVKEGPRFLASVYRPTVINIPATKTLTMNCNATGDPKPNVSWFKNGKSLSTSENTNDGMVITNYSLKLRKLLPQHSGNYSCNVSNSRGFVSHTFNVNIKERLFAKPIILPSVMKAIKFGQSYKLKCVVISGEPLRVYWVRKMGKQSKEGVATERKTIKLDEFIYSYSYTIPNATSEDSGTYWCIAKNNVGVSHRKFQVQVEA